MCRLGTIIRKDSAKCAYKLADFYKPFDVCAMLLRFEELALSLGYRTQNT